MNFSSVWIRIIRLVLFPFAVLYGVIVKIRNFLFDKKILKSSTFNFPIICVGNLSVGGTGKSPMVEYLIRTLNGRYQVATLSRGYKRKTKGYALANEKTTAIDIGDEPMQFHTKFPDTYVAVGEERVAAIPQLLYEKKDTDVIILDDAMQHRQVNAGLTVMLTDYSNLFTRDFFLPTGDLRDARSEYKRADVLVVTKCNPEMNEVEKSKLQAEIKPYPGQQLFFSEIKYGVPYHIIDGSLRPLDILTRVLLVCGIAKPAPLTNYVKKHAAQTEVLYFQDHHIFWIDDLKNIIKQFEELPSGDKIILVTEKDAMRMQKFEEHLVKLPMYVLPIETSFLFGESEKFNTIIENFIKEFKN